MTSRWLKVHPLFAVFLIGGLLATLSGCPAQATGPDPKGPNKGGAAGSPGPDGGTPAKDPGGTKVDDAKPSLPVSGASCEAQPCVYHAGADAHFACLSGSDGMCFHLGARCTPFTSCLFDKKTARYRECSEVVEGACRQFAAECAPPNDCAYDPGEGRYRHCEAARGGACGSYGAPCDPR